MARPRGAAPRRWGLSLALLLALAGCSGGEGSKPTSGLPEVVLEAAAAPRFSESWMLVLVDDATRGPFESDAGWIAQLAFRDYPKAVRQLGPKGGLAAARAHADAAAMYRQAALLSAHALLQTYGVTPQETDPAGTAHQLAVAYAVLGDLDKARAQSAIARGLADDPTAPWHRPWAAWLDQESPQWPPDLSGLPLELPPPAGGEWPSIGQLPHYAVPERTEAARPVNVGDLGAIVALALWHDATARQAAGEQAALVDVFGARYRLPVEPAVPPSGPLPMELLIGSDLLHPADGDFLVALLGAEGAAAVDGWADRSLLAALAQQARVDGKVDPERARDLAAGLRRATLDEMEKAAGSSADFHRTFADIARTALLRGLATVAEVEGDREVSGILRITALDNSGEPHTACPQALLAMTAWDAGNRYPGRGTEILHNLIARVPSLEAARYGLDVLALRVSRERLNQPPGM